MKCVTTTCSGILCCILLVFNLTGFSQICTPDTAGNAQGIFPAVIPNACINVPFEATITVRVPTDTTVMIGGNPVFATIDSLVITDIQGLPPGISYACVSSTCQVPGGTEACFLFSGTPTLGGTFSININSNYYGQLDGSPVIQPNNLVGFYTVTVSDLNIAFNDSSESAAGANNGAVEAVVGGGIPPFTYNWSNGATGPYINGLASGTYRLTVMDANGCSFTDSVTVNQWAVGIDDEWSAGIKNLTISPNPSDGLFKVAIELIKPDELKLEVYDLNGEQIYQEKIEGLQLVEQVIELKNHVPGLYFLRITSNSGISSYKLLTK